MYPVQANGMFIMINVILKSLFRLDNNKEDSSFCILTYRPYEIISVATPTGIAIWKIGLNPDVDGRLSIEKAALLSGHCGEVLLHPPFLMLAILTYASLIWTTIVIFPCR